MAKQTRNVAARAVMTVAFLAVGQPAWTAQSTPPVAPAAPSGVRTRSAILRTLIDDAIERSQTVRRLVHTIQASDGIVYIEVGECRHRRRACLVAVTQAGPYRILWVKVDTRNADSDLLAGSIGHELQHVVEVLSRPTVTDNAAMFLFYDRDGPRRSTFETEAAIEAGNRVRAELRRAGAPPSRP
jgi:hypothetical protein